MPRSLTSYWRIALLLAGTGLYFFANIQRVAIPGAIFNTLQGELNVSASWITGLGAAFMYVYALNQFVIGFLVERYGGRRVILFGSLVFCAGSILFPLSHSLFLLYLSRGLVGFGASALYLSLVQETRQAFRNGHFPFALSAVIFTGYAGGIMANAPFVIGAECIGWRNLLLVIASCSLLCWLLFAVACGMAGLPGATSGDERFCPSFRSCLDILRRPDNRIMCLCVGIHFGLYYVIQTVIGKKFLEDFLGLSSARAAWILSLMAVLAALSGFAFALLSKLLGGRERMFICMAGCLSTLVFLGLVIMTGLDIRNMAPAVCLCALATVASLSSIAIPVLYATNEPSQAGLAICLLNFSLYFFVALFGNAVGLLLNCFESEALGSSRIYSRTAWLAVFSALLFFAFVVMLFSFCLTQRHKPSSSLRP